MILARCGWYSDEKIHRLELARAGRLVDNDLQALNLAEEEVTGEQVHTRRIDRCLEHSVTRPIEADELPPDAPMYRARVDARARRRAVDGGHLELSP